jgi:hypothetical protein
MNAPIVKKKWQQKLTQKNTDWNTSSPHDQERDGKKKGMMKKVGGGVNIESKGNLRVPKT